MSFAERTVWAELLASLTILTPMAWFLYTRYAAGAFDGPDGPMQWARLVLMLIAGAIVVAIAVSILFAIGYRIVTGETPDDRTDERDRLIAGLGYKVTAITTGACIVVAIAGLAWGFPVLVALNGVLAACALGDLSGNLAKLVRYRMDR